MALTCNNSNNDNNNFNYDDDDDDADDDDDKRTDNTCNGVHLKENTLEQVQLP